MNRNGAFRTGDAGSSLAWLTIRLGAIIENYRTCQQLSGTKVAGVVKADAYGLGAGPVARALGDGGCDTFFVARCEEGIRLRPTVPDARIFVLDGLCGSDADALITHRLVPTLNSLDEMAAWSAAARAQHETLDTAIHFDTGMNRLGMPREDVGILSAEASARLKGLNLVLLMSHLACSDDASAALNIEQLSRFRAALATLPSAPASLSPSGGVLLGKDYAFDLVRPGIALYGGNPRNVAPNPFRTVARLAGRVLQLRRVDKGESVGYGATFRTRRPTTLATVALGYADGLMRAIGNRGAGAVGGVRAPIAGRISMDLVTLDVTDIRDVELGCEVEFLGDTISLEDIAAAANTANYEILTGLGDRVPRNYVSES
jgi:alanine racemase